MPTLSVKMIPTPKHIEEAQILYIGKPWETGDGETPEEGRSANIGGLFVEIERLKTREAALLAVAQAAKALPCDRGGFLDQHGFGIQADEMRAALSAE